MKENLERFWSEIQESVGNYWQEFLKAFPRIVFAFVVFAVLAVIVLQISKLIKGKLTGKARDPLFGRFLAKLIRYTLLLVCVIVFFNILGLTGLAGGLLAGAGLSALIFGFAFKDIAENFLAGIILTFDRPFSLNDTIKIEDHVGKVRALNFRTTHLKTFDEKDVFIPNSVIIKQSLTNMTKDGILRLDFVVGIAFEDDISKALEYIVESVKGVDGVLKEKVPFTIVEELGTSTVNIRVFFWTKTEDYRKAALILKSEVIKSVKEYLEAKGFTMPANIQELKLYDKRKSIPVEILSFQRNNKMNESILQNKKEL